MSTDGDDPRDKPPQPPSTLAGVVPQPPKPGLPPPRSTHGGPPAPRPGSQSQPPFSPTGAPPPGQRPFSQPQGTPPTPTPPAHPQRPLSPQAQPQRPSQAASHPQPVSGVPAAPASGAPSQPFASAPSQPYGQQSSAPTQPYSQPPFGAEPSQPHAQPPLGAEPSQPYQQSAPAFHDPSQPVATPPAQPYQQPSPFAAPPGQTDPAWARGYSGGGVPEARLVESESSPIEQLAEAAAEVPGRFVAFLKLSAKRAFRIRIEPSEVLPDERQQLISANPPVTDENLQAFLAWRRSVLFLVATILTVLSIMGLVDSLGGYKVATSVRFVKLFPTLAECAFCLICWIQLRNWTSWRKQRRWLFVGWLLFMLTPFLVFVYPLKLAVMDAGRALTVDQMRELGYHGVYNRVVAPFAFAMIALLQLAPKVISLMPGLIRSSMVIKLLFPGASAPGWLIVMCAPLYAMIAYALLIIPYQFTASGWFIFGVILLMIAQGIVTRSGFALAKPLTQEEALFHIKRVRKFYMVLLLTAALSIIGGLGLLVSLLHMKWTTVVTTILKFECNVMILTTIGADLVVTNLDRARGYTEGKEHIEEETENKIAAFVGLNAPPTAPGSAQH
ncbi:MAG TPA: hypothetical protein VIV40_01600 [Kofleriaceae bacterium]